MYAMTACPWARGVHGIFASSERKARDAAQFLADGLGLNGYSVIANLGENDRSATGFLAKDEFEATVDAITTSPAAGVGRDDRPADRAGLGSSLQPRADSVAALPRRSPAVRYIRPDRLSWVESCPPNRSSSAHGPRAVAVTRKRS
jgi:hypothetical protein